MNLSNDELVHIASFLQDEDFRSFRNCNMRTRTLEYYPVRYYISDMKSIYSITRNINKCIFIIVSTMMTYFMLITLIIGLSILTTNTSREYFQDIIGYICIISTGILITCLILFLLKSFNIKRNRVPIIRSTTGEIIV